jgi:hypothetical protein
MNPKSRANLIYLSRLPKKMQAAKLPKAKPAAEAKDNTYVRMRKLMDHVDKGPGLLFGEALSVPEAQAWLNRAYQTIIGRSETINSLPEREEYTKLANLIQTATPISNATAESVESNLQILRQQIQVGEQDSHALRTLKQHLITSIGEVLAPPDEETPPEEGAPDEMGGGDPTLEPEVPGPGGAGAPPGGGGAAPPPLG